MPTVTASPVDTGRRLVSPHQVHGLRVVGAAEYDEAATGVAEPAPVTV